MYRRVFFLSVISTIFIMTGCEQPQRPESQTGLPIPTAQETAAAPLEAPRDYENAIHAVAELQPTEGNQATGRVEFTQVPGGVRVVAEIEGLTSGNHGFHVHEFGDCSAPDAESAGGHFNPHETPHGNPDSPPDQRHAGDLGNIEGNEDGRGFYERVDHVIELTGPDSILGRSVVVHAEEDDFISQPTGDAGDRIACGVIRQVPQP